MSATELSVAIPSLTSRVGWAALNAVQLLFTIAVTAAGFPVAMLLRLAGPRAPLRMAAWYWAPLLLGGAGARLEVEGAGQVDWSRPLVLACNHQSVIDIVALFRAVPVPLRFVLKREMLQVPLVGWYARSMGMVFLDRGNARRARESLLSVKETLRGGAAFCAFPEGTRSRDGTVGPFRGGAFQLAIEAGADVVPVSIEGSGAVLRPAGFGVRPGLIRVRFGAPLATEALQPDDRQQLARRAHADVTALLAGHH